MKAMNFKGLGKKLGLLVTVAGVGVLLSMPSQAKPGREAVTETPNPLVNGRETVSETSPAASEEKGKSAGTIVDVAVSAGSFKTLTAALQAAGWVDALKGEGPFTVFAPTDEAFAKLPKGTVEKLLKPENKEMLEKILTYHVVSGKVMSADLSSGQVATVEGSPINVKVGSAVMVNDAKVVKADVSASNGVIHAIDKVMLPPDVQSK